MDDQRLLDDRSGAHPWVERRVRILEDDLHLAPQASQVAATQVQHVAAVEYDLA